MIDLDEIARRGVRTTEEIDGLIALARAGRMLYEAVEMQDRNWKGAPIVSVALAAFREAQGEVKP